MTKTDIPVARARRTCENVPAEEHTGAPNDGNRNPEIIKPNALSSLCCLSKPRTHLLQVPVPDDLVDDDTNSARSDVVDDSGTAVVVLVRHAALHGGVGLDVDDVADLVVDQVRRHLDRAGLCGQSEW